MTAQKVSDAHEFAASTSHVGRSEGPKGNPETGEPYRDVIIVRASRLGEVG